MNEPRRHAAVEIKVTIDGQDERTFTADTTSTGDIYTAARWILMAVKDDAANWLHDMSRQS